MMTMVMIPWRFSVAVNALISINAVALHWARLVLGWVTAFGQVNCLTVRKQPPRPTQPAGSVNEHQAIAGNAKAGMARSDCGWTCGCAGNTVRSPENTCHTWALLRCVSRRCAMSSIPLPLRWLRRRRWWWWTWTFIKNGRTRRPLIPISKSWSN